MEKIFQRFSLNVEKLEKLASENPKFNSSVLNAGNSIREELSAKGYDVLFSGDFYGTVPLFVIIGKDIKDRTHKADFGEAVGKFMLPYKSEEFYVQRDK